MNNTHTMEQSGTMLSNFGPMLFSTLSISFLVTTFMLSEYLRHSDETPRKKRPFYIGSLVMIVSVWLGAIGLGSFALSEIGPSWMIGGSVLMLALQVVFITAAVSYLGIKVLYD